MADKTYKQAYDDDQAGSQYGDIIKASDNANWFGLTHAIAGDPGNLTEIGITLSQLKTAIDSPGFVAVDSPAIGNSNGLSAFEVLDTVTVPAGFVTTDTIFSMDITWSRQTADEEIICAVRTSLSGNYILQVSVPGASGNVQDGLRKRITVGFSTLQLMTFAGGTSPDSYGIFPFTPGSIFSATPFDQGFDFQIGAWSPNPSTAGYVLQNYSILGYRKAVTSF